MLRPWLTPPEHPCFLGIRLWLFGTGWSKLVPEVQHKVGAQQSGAAQAAPVFILFIPPSLGSNTAPGIALLRTLPGILFLVAGTYETGSCMPCSPFPSMQ